MTKLNHSARNVAVNLEETYKEICHNIAMLLGVPPEGISINFIEIFEKIRQDVLEKIPEQVSKYLQEKQRYEESASIPLAQLRKKRHYKSVAPYIDPRVKSIPEEIRKFLLSQSSGFIGTSVPNDIAIRAMSAIKAAALLALSGEDPSRIQGISNAQKINERDRGQVTGLTNWLARNTNRR